MSPLGTSPDFAPVKRVSCGIPMIPSVATAHRRKAVRNVRFLPFSRRSNAGWMFMDFRDTPDGAKFRQELRSWFEQNLPEGWKERGHGRGRTEEEISREWSKKLAEAGYAGLTWPKDFGGA